MVNCQKQKQKLTAGNQPACSHLASGPMDIYLFNVKTFVFLLSFILLIDKGGVGLLYIYRVTINDSFLFETIAF
jgi:hypothetical protein